MKKIGILVIFFIFFGNVSSQETEQKDIVLSYMHIDFAEVIDVFVYKNHMYLLRRPNPESSTMSLVTFSIINPASPLLIDIDAISDVGSYAKLSVKDFVLYIWGSENIILCDISQLANPQVKKKKPSNGVISFQTLGNHGIKNGGGYLWKRLNLEDPWNPKFSKAEEEDINYLGLNRKPRSLHLTFPDKVSITDYYRVLEDVEESYISILRDLLFKLYEKPEKLKKGKKNKKVLADKTCGKFIDEVIQEIDIKETLKKTLKHYLESQKLKLQSKIYEYLGKGLPQNATVNDWLSHNHFRSSHSFQECIELLILKQAKSKDLKKAAKEFAQKGLKEYFQKLLHVELDNSGKEIKETLDKRMKEFMDKNFKDRAVTFIFKYILSKMLIRNYIFTLTLEQLLDWVFEHPKVKPKIGWINTFLKKVKKIVDSPMDTLKNILPGKKKEEIEKALKEKTEDLEDAAKNKIEEWFEGTNADTIKFPKNASQLAQLIFYLIAKIDSKNLATVEIIKYVLREQGDFEGYLKIEKKLYPKCREGMQQLLIHSFSNLLPEFQNIISKNKKPESALEKVAQNFEIRDIISRLLSLSLLQMASQKKVTEKTTIDQLLQMSGSELSDPFHQFIERLKNKSILNLHSTWQQAIDKAADDKTSAKKNLKIFYLRFTQQIFPGANEEMTLKEATSNYILERVPSTEILELLLHKLLDKVLPSFSKYGYKSIMTNVVSPIVKIKNGDKWEGIRAIVATVSAMSSSPSLVISYDNTKKFIVGPAVYFASKVLLDGIWEAWGEDFFGFLNRRKGVSGSGNIGKLFEKKVLIKKEHLFSLGKYIYAFGELIEDTTSENAQKALFILEVKEKNGR